MSTLENHARQIRQAVADLRLHGEKDPSVNFGEFNRTMRAVEALEEAIMRTLPMLGMDPLVPEDPVADAYQTWLTEDR